MSFFFVQMTDPQFGMFAFFSELTEDEVEEYRRRELFARHAPEKVTGFADETRLYTQAIEGANRLKPAFVVMCGDMVQNPNDQSQVDELFRITALLDDDIDIHWAPGNADVGNAPTPESLALYRERFGPDNYSFEHDGCHFTVINSSVCFNPKNVPDEWESLVRFLSDDLSKARANGCDDVILFAHHPLFLEDADDADSGFVIPRERRRVILDILHGHEVSAVFAGHWHRNNYAEDGNLQMVVTGAIGYPLGDDPSGLRVVKVDSGVTHRYYAMDHIPDSLEL
ncbi:MAG: metallophosphoesterase [SAR202 cluster bacterium]|nr:metallophosphoesterase [SAR202 cluster bacterium]MDP6665744.1 metallophosphoesterase [SAR202 cluster bacterium]MDP6798329.1 metallophosphoesterase [SAR202 cluster bacterium]